MTTNPLIAEIRCVTTSSTCPCIDVDKCISICTEDDTFSPSCTNADSQGSCVEPLPEPPKATACCRRVSVCRLAGDSVTANYCVTVKQIQGRRQFFHAVVVLTNTSNQQVPVSQLILGLQQGIPFAGTCSSIPWETVPGVTFTVPLNPPFITANSTRTVSVDGSFELPADFNCDNGFFRLFISSPNVAFSPCFQCSEDCPEDLSYCLKDPADNPEDSVERLITEAELNDPLGLRFSYERTFTSNAENCPTDTINNTADLYQLESGETCETVTSAPIDSANATLIINCARPETTGTASRNCNINDSFCVCKSSEVKPPNNVTGCVFTQGYWRTHGPAGCSAGNNENEWPAFTGEWACNGNGLLLGNVCYTDLQLCSILQRPVAGNGLISLAHQLIAAKLNVLNGAPLAPIGAIIDAADSVIGNLVVPPVGNGFLSPASVSSLVNQLTNYNEGNIPGVPHCGEEGDSVCNNTLILYSINTTRTRTETCTVDLHFQVCVSCLSYSKEFRVEVESSTGVIESATKTFSLGPSDDRICHDINLTLDENQVPNTDTTLKVTVFWRSQDYNVSTCTLEDLPGEENSLVTNVDIRAGDTNTTTAKLTDTIDVQCVQRIGCSNCKAVVVIPDVGQQNPPSDPVTGEPLSESCNEFITSNTTINGEPLTPETLQYLLDLLNGGLSLNDVDLFDENGKLNITFVVFPDSCVCTITNTATVTYTHNNGQGTASNSVTDNLRPCEILIAKPESKLSKEVVEDKKGKIITKSKQPLVTSSKEKETNKIVKPKISAAANKFTPVVVSGKKLDFASSSVAVAKRNYTEDNNKRQEMKKK